MTIVDEGDTAPLIQTRAGGWISWLDLLNTAPRFLKVLATLILLMFVALLDEASGAEISLYPVYLLPIIFATLSISLAAGRATSVLGGILATLVDHALTRVHSHYWILAFNFVIHLALSLAICQLVFSLRLAHARERAFARTDPLTGIANSRVLKERMEHCIAQARRNGKPFTLTYIDLDRFKQVNDTRGHAEGDRLLQTVTKRITDHLRTTDLVARLGGDEFAILMPETDAEQASASIERIAAALTETLQQRWGSGATFGSVTFACPPESYESALQRADSLMYQGKTAGRGHLFQETWPAG